MLPLGDIRRVQESDEFVGLAFAENKLIWPVVEQWFREPLSHAESLYDLAYGSAKLRQGLVDLMQRNTSKPLDPEHLVCGDGALSVLESLLFCLLDEGDSVAVLLPCYSQHRTVLMLRNRLCIEGYDSFERLLEAVAQRRVRAVVWTNPSNPAGTVPSRELVGQLVETCAASEVHLVSDEMYSTCVFGGSFVSVLDFCSDETHRRFVHAVSGLAKLGWSGAKGKRCAWAVRVF